MAFLPAIKTSSTTKTDKRASIKAKRKGQVTSKKTGYRISLTDINTTHDNRNELPSSLISHKNNYTSEQDNLPSIEEPISNNEKKRNNEKVVTQTLKLPKCPNASEKSMFWLEPLGIWLPLQHRRKLYEKFSRRLDLLQKDPDCFLDPCPHIPRCDHSRCWSAVRLERQKLRELKELRNNQLLQKSTERHQNMQEIWLTQLSNRTEMLTSTPSHLRLQNFRKIAEGFVQPLNDTQRLERLAERQKDWREAWRLSYERREKSKRNNSPQFIYPRIVVTDYEYISTRDEHLNTMSQSRDQYRFESYQAVCTPVQSFSPDKNFRTQTLAKRKGVHMIEVSRPYTRLDPLEKEPGVIVEPEENLSPTENGRSSRSLDLTRLYSTVEMPVNAISGESEEYENTTIGNCDLARSSFENDVRPYSLLTTSDSNSKTSVDTVGTIMDTSESSLEKGSSDEIKLADTTARLMRRLVPVPLGVSSGKIPNDHITASSALDIYHAPGQARLHNQKQGSNGGAWFPRKHDISPYLQIDLGHVVKVLQVATQGNPESAVRCNRQKRWVTKFSLEFSMDGVHWEGYKELGDLKVFEGNSDLNSVVVNSLDNAIATRYIRFRPKEWHNGIAMRVEVFGSSSLREDDDVVETEKEIFDEAPKGSTDFVVRKIGKNEWSKRELIFKKQQDVEAFFREMDDSSENKEFDLSAEIRAVTPITLHSPPPFLMSPSEQSIRIEEYMESEVYLQNLHLRELSFVSETNSSVSPDTSRDTIQTTNSEGIHSASDVEIMSGERTPNEQERDIISNASNSEITSKPEHEEEAERTNDTINSEITEKDEEGLFDENHENELKLNEEKNDTDKQKEQLLSEAQTSSVTTPPASPPQVNWVRGLERAQADGSIQRQLMREKMAEERRKKLAMLYSKRTMRSREHISEKREDLDEIGSFLETYCIIGERELIVYKQSFEEFDKDKDGFLWPEEVLEALEQVNTNLLVDSHLTYVFRVLEQCDCQAEVGIGLRLFSVIAALSHRVASLNERMKMLISQCDLKTIDYTLERVKMLFECYVNADSMRISRTDLWIGLAAGGLRRANEIMEHYLPEKHTFDFLDFLTYLPLFQEIHEHVVENPLTLF